MIFPLVGNSNIKSSVENAVAEGKLPHAIIIEGDVGSGRHTLANYLCFSQVCSGNNPPCGECKNCNLVQGGNHPDIKVIAPEDGKKNIAVSQIRELKTEVFIKPHMADKKVFIIDRAQTMNEQSQNALLKVLEEPPQNVAFILITETKAALLETVISRCICLSISIPEKGAALNYMKETTEFSEREITLSLEQSRNNIGKALLSLKGKKLSKTENAAKEFISQMLEKNTYNMLKITSMFDKNRVEAAEFLKALKQLLVEEIKKNISGRNGKKLSNFYTEISKLEQSLNTNINLALFFSILVSRTENF